MPGGLADDLHGNLNLNLLALVHTQKIGVNELAGKRVTLNVLDESQDVFAIQVHGEESVSLALDGEEQLVGVHGEVNRLSAVAVNNRGDAAVTAQLASRTLAKVGTCNSGKLICHSGSPISVRCSTKRRNNVVLSDRRYRSLGSTHRVDNGDSRTRTPSPRQPIQFSEVFSGAPMGDCERCRKSHGGTCNFSVL